MKHAREDYNRFQDPENKIPEDEPVMLFRAQDKHFISVLEYYRNLVVEDDPGNPIVELVEAHIELARKWPVRKVPDI